MKEKDMIAREWIEIHEDSKDGTIVFRPADYPVPPARGRRHLQLSDSGEGRGLGAGPSDKLELKSEGKWELDGKNLRLNIREWEGDYEIEDLQDSILILRKCH